MSARFSLPAPTDGPAVRAVLVTAGKKMRAGEPVSQAVRGWMRTLSRDDLVNAVAMGGHGIEASTDVRCAALRLCVERGWEIVAVPPAVEDADSRTDDDPSASALGEAEIALGAPPDEIVLAYAREGVMTLYVEGVAARSPAFADELAASIDGLAEAGMTVHERARSWRALRGDATSAEEPYAAEAKLAAPPRALPRARPLARLAVAAGLLLAIGGAAVYGAQARRTAVVRAQQAERQRQLAAQEEEIYRLRLEIATKEREVRALQAEADLAATEAARAAASARLTRARAEQQRMKESLARAKATAPRASASASGKPRCECQPLDPMCSCF